LHPQVAGALAVIGIEGESRSTGGVPYAQLVEKSGVRPDCAVLLFLYPEMTRTANFDGQAGFRLARGQ
jgi:hypothetical protein